MSNRRNIKSGRRREENDQTGKRLEVSSLHVHSTLRIRLETKRKLQDRYEYSHVNQQKKTVQKAPFSLIYDCRVVCVRDLKPINIAFGEGSAEVEVVGFDRSQENLLCQSLFLLLNRLLGREFDGLVQQDQCRVALTTTG
jgi:hypothetical protein